MSFIFSEIVNYCRGREENKVYIEASARGLLTIFFRRQRKFFYMLTLVLFVGGLYLSSMVRVYDVHESFLIKPGQGAVPDIGKSDLSEGESSTSAHNELVQSNIKILLSDDLLGTVVDKVGVERLYPGIRKAVDGTDSPEHEAIIRLQTKDLIVSNDSESSVVDVTVKNKDPQIAKEFADALIVAFIARQTAIYSAPQIDFLDKQIAESKKKFEDSQKEFQDFKEQVGISNLDQEVTELLAEKTALSGFSLQAVTAAQQNFSKLASDQAAALATYRPDSPVIKRLNESIAIERQEVLKRQQDLNASGVDNSSMAPKIAALNKRMAYLEAHRSEYTQLEQNVQINEDDYKSYRQNGEMARDKQLLGEQGITRISVMDRPILPIKSEPLKRGLLLIALFLTGSFLGFAMVFLFEMMDESVAYPEQITAGLSLPVLASFGRGQ